MPALAAGKIDLMHVVWDSPENRKKLFISEPWVVDSAWMVSLESSGINSPADVTGRRVWIQNNGRHRYLAGENFPGAIVEAQDSYLRAVEGVCLGKAEAALVSPVIAGSNLAFERLPACENVKLKFTLLPKGRIWFGIGAPRNNPAAIAAAKAIREEMGTMVEDGTFSRIYMKWALDPNNAATVLHYLNVLRERDRYMLVAIVVLVIVLLLLSWQGFRLRRASRIAHLASRAKGDFLANMSHELRTPLNGIIGMTRLALETEASAESREFLSIASASAESLLSVVNEILDFSKLETGKVRMEELEIDLHELLESSAKAFALPAHQKGLELVCEIQRGCPQLVCGDPVRLRQVLFNLIGNALKFTARGEVKISARLVSSDGNPQLHFTVADTGIGVPAAKLKTIFEPFSQADSSTARKYGGTGLGLAISRGLVLSMGGRIWVESAEQHGASFHFVVPLKLSRRAFPASVRDLPAVRALVVDDNAAARSAAEEMLRQWGLRTESASDAASALAALEEAKSAAWPYSLLLIDSEMPVMDGFELASKIHFRFGLGNAIIMMLTSDKCSLTAGRCRELGIVSHLIKPVGQAELFAAARRVLQHEPIVTAATLDDKRGVVHEKPVQPLHILLAEDNKVNQKLAVAMLQRAGHSVTVAENGREALELLDAHHFDLVLMDVQMPEMDGYEATGIIRRQEASTGSHLPIIAMTAHAMKADVERCFAAGMDSYISKPFQPREFLEAIEWAKPFCDQLR